MLTYNDYLTSSCVTDFIDSAIREHQASALFKDACAADRYYHLENPTIMRYQKLLHNMAGRAVPDCWSPNNKVPSNWYFYFTVQAVGHLLANGVYFDDPAVKQALGRGFDRNLTRLAIEAKNGGAAFGFWNCDRLEVFSVREFVPLFDEETGVLRAGIRFWQMSDKAAYCTLYDPFGYVTFRRSDDGTLLPLSPLQPYVRTVESAPDGSCTDVTDPADAADPVLPVQDPPPLPIFPLWNTLRQSDIAGNRHVIDAYDLMASGLVNNVDEGNFIYWILKNCEGMNDEDDARFLDQLRRHHFAHANGDDGAGVESHTVETPFEAHGAALDRLERQLFVNFMAADVRSIRGGSITATEIRAAYEPLNAKTDMFEYEVIGFLENLLAYLGIDAAPSFKRSQIVNQLEETEMVLAAADVLDTETLLRKLPWVTVDEVEGIMARRKGEGGEE